MKVHLVHIFLPGHAALREKPLLLMYSSCAGVVNRLELLAKPYLVLQFLEQPSELCRNAVGDHRSIRDRYLN